MPDEPKGGDDFESLGFDPATFAQLEADFESTLVELSEPNLERFKALQQELPAAVQLYDSSGCKQIKYVLKRLYYSR